MQKFVYYNGKTESDKKCSPASKLKYGKKYMLASVDFKQAGQINYILSDVAGKFNAKWFDDEPISIKKRIKHKINTVLS